MVIPTPKEVLPNIHLMRFSNRHDLCSTFVRFQEHYENPHFQGKIFDHEEFEDWYAKERGQFSYYDDWSGMNIPSTILRPFREGEFDPLRRKEQALLDVTSKLREPFYLIGTLGEGETLLHELGHGLFFVSAGYKKEVLDVIHKYDTEPLANFLHSRSGYHESVIPDELHAYTLASLDCVEEKSGLDLSYLRVAEKEIRQIFAKYGSEPELFLNREQ